MESATAVCQTAEPPNVLQMQTVKLAALILEALVFSF